MTSSSALQAGRVMLTGLLLLVLWFLARCSPATTPATQAAPPFVLPLVSPLVAPGASPGATPTPAAPQSEAYELTDLLFLGTLDWLQQRSTEVVRQ
ncbi:MAG TPA: hypothetical protein VNK95_07310 [Caldilineaceae bacterium]|nr:hypothetical protein [Caldilineaceae bacterium]